MTYKTFCLPAPSYSLCVAEALQSAGWDVSSQSLHKDPFLINHIAADELKDAVQVALDAIVNEQLRRTAGEVSQAEYDALKDKLSAQL